MKIKKNILKLNVFKRAFKGRKEIGMNEIDGSNSRWKPLKDCFSPDNEDPGSHGAISAALEVKAKMEIG